MHLVNIQCDNAPERALHLTGEEEEEEGQMVRIVIMWSIRSDENNNIGLVYCTVF